MTESIGMGTVYFGIGLILVGIGVMILTLVIAMAKDLFF